MRPFIRLAALCLPLLAGPAFADCGEDIRAMTSELLGSAPYSVVTVSNSGGVSSTVTTEMLPPDTMHRRSEEAGAVTEVIVLGGRGWTTDGGAWAGMPEAAARSMAEGLASDAHRKLEHTIDDQCVGQAMVDGQGYVSYSFTEDKDGSSAKTTVLVDPRTFRPYKMLVTGTTDGAPMKSVTSYSFGQTFDIEAPL